MRPPALILSSLLLLFAVHTCERGPNEDSSLAQRSAPAIGLGPALDERAVLVGDVVEQLEGPSYVYLRLSIVGDSAHPVFCGGRTLRWVALEDRGVALGQRVRVRSLARRSRVWEPALERDFESLDYVALLEVLRP